jgi:LCP family protein required for cell wall assembly
MYEEPRRPRRAKPPRRRGCCLMRLIKLALAALLIYGVYLLFTSGILSNLGSLSHYTPGGDLSVTAGLNPDWVNILLMGSDSRGGEKYGRTDTMMIASIHTGSGQCKLTSIMRDTVVPIEGHGSDKINAAYKFGGPELAMKTVNKAFGTNITRYAVIDFSGFPKLVDALGGIELDITEAELEQLNHNVKSISYKVKELDSTPLDHAGENVHVNGAQALGYSRIRHIDSDYMRAARQREVLNALLGKLRKTKNPISLTRFFSAALGAADTNINLFELASLGWKVLSSGEMSQYRIPAEGAYESGTYDGVWCIRPNLGKNQKLLRQFIYGQ